MFNWLNDLRRKKLTEAPFPDAWEAIITRNVAHYCMLDEIERSHLRALVQVFIAEKDWEGCGGLELTDEIKEMILARKPTSEIKKVAMEQGMLPIRKNGLSCVKAGVTSLDELNRVTVKEWV